MREETMFSPQISRLRAWTLLADLNRYEAWHPHYRFGAGVVELGNKIDMTWTLMGKQASLEARIVANDKPDIIRWRAATLPLFSIEEGYEIYEDETGLHVRHSFECKGILGLLARPLATGLRRQMRTQDASFMAAVKRTVRAVSPVNRHKRRSLSVIKGRGKSDG